MKPNTGAAYTLPQSTWIFLVNTSTVLEAPLDPTNFQVEISASTINVAFLSVTNINIEQNLSVTNIFATCISVTNLEVTHISVTSVSATQINVTNISATNISVTNLSVTNINAKNLVVQATAEFQTNVSVSGDVYAANYFGKFTDLGEVSGAVSINVSAASFYKMSVGGSATIHINQWPPATYAANVMLEVWKGGGSTITWSSISFITSSGALQGSPASAGDSLQATGPDFILAWSRDAGATKYAKVVR